MAGDITKIRRAVLAGQEKAIKIITDFGDRFNLPEYKRILSKLTPEQLKQAAQNPDLKEIMKKLNIEV